MYCSHCHNQVNDTDSFCRYCGKALNIKKIYCTNCGHEIHDYHALCTHCGYQNHIVKKTYERKSKIIAGLLGLFFGGLGVHNFYLGYSSKAVIQLVCSLCGIFTLGLSSLVACIWGMIEGILIFVGTIDKDGNDQYLK